MTTPSDNNSLAAIIAAWEAKQDAYERLTAELVPRNQTALFDALTAASVTTVVVSFDGYSDEGQITNVEVKAGEQVVEMPQVQIEIACAARDKTAAEYSTVSIATAVEYFVYLLLEKSHCGWENNDGAYGNFTFDVARRRITLNYNERYTTSKNFQHVF
jgi:hypothetical protein